MVSQTKTTWWILTIRIGAKAADLNGCHHGRHDGGGGGGGRSHGGYLQIFWLVIVID
jgi:hypothetical protein